MYKLRLVKLNNKLAISKTSNLVSISNPRVALKLEKKKPRITIQSKAKRGLPGQKGDEGDAATISVGTVTTVPYNQPAAVINVGDENEAVFDFKIPKGRDGSAGADGVASVVAGDNISVDSTDPMNPIVSAIIPDPPEIPVTSVNGKTGDVVVTKSDVGLSNVPNLDTTTAIAQTHTHTNKDLLDSYTQTEANLASAVALKHSHTNKGILDATTASFTSNDRVKLDGVETGAEVNNISDSNATDLTDGGNTTLHYHASDRDRANHTGTQSIATITGLQTELDSKADTFATGDIIAGSNVSISGTLTDRLVGSGDIVINASGGGGGGGAVDSVNGKTGVVVLDASDVGADPEGSAAAALGSAEDYTDTAIASIDYPVDSVNGATGAVVLDTDDIDDTATNRYTNDSDITRLANTSGTNTGDQDLSGYVPNTRTVNGKALSSNITITKSDVGLSNVDNTSDSAKNAAAAVLTNKDLTSATNTFPTFNQSTTGNAATATKLATARNINGAPFDGTSNITVADATKEPIIAAGTTSQYWRGDKSWQTLDKAAVGLANVDNTSDVNKPISTATQTALSLKANSADLATVATTGSYNDLSNRPTIPSQYTDEMAQDAVGGILTDSATLDLVYDDTGNAITGNVLDSPTLQGNSGAYYRSRTNHTGTQPASTITGLGAVATSNDYNDLSNKPTIPTQYTDEQAQDAVGNILTDSSTFDFTYNDALNTITGAVLDSPTLGGQSGTYYRSRANHTGTQAASTITGLSTVATSGDYNDLSNRPSIPTQYTDEMAQDAVGTILTDTSTLDFTYNDAANTITAAVLDSPLLGGNSSSYHLNRTNHTGTQAISTVTNLQTTLDGKESAFSKGNLIQGSNVTLTGTLTNRLVGTGDITISATGGGTTVNYYQTEDVQEFAYSGSNIFTVSQTIGKVLAATINGQDLDSAEISNTGSDVTLTPTSYTWDINDVVRIYFTTSNVYSSTAGLSLGIVSKTVNYTISDTDYTVLMDTSAGNLTATLPSAVGRTGKIYTIKKKANDSNQMTIATTSSQTIDGSLTYVTMATVRPSVTVQSDGANWWII